MDDLEQTLKECHQLLLVIEQRSAINGLNHDALGLGQAGNEPEPHALLISTTRRERDKWRLSSPIKTT